MMIGLILVMIHQRSIRVIITPRIQNTSEYSSRMNRDLGVTSILLPDANRVNHFVFSYR